MDRSALDDAMAEGAGVGLAFWQAFADAELFLLLAEEADGDTLSPRVFAVSEGAMVLVFDREDRMAGFSPVPVPYAALPGRVVAGLAAGQGLSVGVNLGSGAASETVLPPEALAWLVETLDTAPAEESDDRMLRVGPPRLAPGAEPVVAAVLAAVAGRADEAILADVAWESGRQGSLLAIPGLAAAARPAVARALAQALALSGLEEAALDLAFPPADSRLAEGLRRAGRRYVPGAAEPPPAEPPRGPGMDPARPPVLK